MKNIETLINSLEDFPTLPTIYSKLLDLLADTHTTAQDLADFISNDPSAATKILKTVNSPIYGLQGTIDTMSEAISHVGFNEVKNLVMALSVIDLFSKMDSIENFNIVDFWKHSIAVGVISKLLGQQLGIKHADSYYLAGILHDIGKMFFLRSFSDEYAQVMNAAIYDQRSVSDVEQQLFGMTHLEAGGLIAEKWQLPENIRQTIQNHNDGKQDGRYNEQIACIHLADKIANILELGVPTLYIVSRPDPGLWEFLKVEQGLIESLYPKIMEAYQSSVRISLT
ncbi:MAG: HDOD domain-containing protein [Verrucomicrobiae bacterium]|nr:HDOD domain-containing protein [Verrucomicrobiae bacterium]